MTASVPSRAVSMTADLVRCASVTPEEGGALGLIEAWLKPYGFKIHRPVFQTAGHYAVENLYARIGSGAPCLVFAGHTDVVPPGDLAGWSRPPFSGDIADGAVWGRGASDMKSGVAAAIAAVLDHLDAHGAPAAGSLAFLITGDEEADAVDGTVRLLEWAQARGEVFSACVLGEPTNPEAMGDMVKIGRRGSLSGDLFVDGVQGHVAYPQLARNPIDGLMRLMAALKEPLDAGTAHFLPSNLEFTALDCGNAARNVIPARAGARFNIRFNDLWTSATLGAELRRRLAGVNDAPHYELTRRPVLSTTGGTSDARFIQAYCPVVEFGVVGKTMHKVNENAAIADIDCLTAVYGRVIARFLGP
jgi:succinyl-diaminopimelate desuccinylase